MTEWYQYPSDSPGGSYGQIQEPLGGGYLKPDVNIAIPSGVPITSAAPGTVTSVQDFGKNSGGLSVVVALDNPLNGEATHVAYNYLGSESVNPGDKVTAGQQLGVAGSPYGINFALGLTPDKSWGNGSFNLNAKGDPNLDPHILLNALLGGKPLPTLPPGTSASGGKGKGSQVPIIGPLIDWLNQQKDTLGATFKNTTAWLTNPVRLFKMIAGVGLLFIAFILLIAPTWADIGEKVKGAMEDTIKSTGEAAAAA